MNDIVCSIHDFAPMLRKQEYLFRGLSEIGLDGVELAVGFKSRWNSLYYKQLSNRYNLPIKSLHQPFWDWLGLYFDERTYEIASEIGVKKIVVHPLPKLSLNDTQMETYLERLSVIQVRYGLEILLENMPVVYNQKLIGQLFPIDTASTDIRKVVAAACKHNLKITLDTDHLHMPYPQKEDWFGEVLKYVGNIHISSFTQTRKHLPLNVGILDVGGFVAAAVALGYKGAFTLEVNSPGLVNLFDYDFRAIRESVDVLRKCMQSC